MSPHKRTMTGGALVAALQSLLPAAKARPGSVLYATPGNGATPHLATELFARAAGITLAHVPSKGEAPAINDVLGGQLPLVAVNAVEVLPHVKAGRLRVLAVLSAERVSTLSDSPTIAEPGLRASRRRSGMPSSRRGARRPLSSRS